MDVCVVSKDKRQNAGQSRQRKNQVQMTYKVQENEKNTECFLTGQGLTSHSRRILSLGIS
jgi:hypothetical protein